MLQSTDGARLGVERLERPKSFGPPEPWDEGEFNGRLTLDTGDESLAGYVSWIPHYVDEAVAFFDDLAAHADGWEGTKTIRTEDDDLRLECSHDGSTIRATARLLDWWDPYKENPSPYDHKELTATMTLEPEELRRFADEFRALVGRDR